MDDNNLTRRLDVVLDHIEETLPAGAGTVRELIDEVERLRARCEALVTQLEQVQSDYGQADADLDEARAERDAIRAQYRELREHCRYPWCDRQRLVEERDAALRGTVASK